MEEELEGHEIDNLSYILFSHLASENNSDNQVTNTWKTGMTEHICVNIYQHHLNNLTANDCCCCFK